MNIDQNNCSMFQLIRLIVLFAAATSVIGCFAQNKLNKPDETAQKTLSNTQNDSSVECQAVEEQKDAKVPEEWKGSPLNRAVIYHDLLAVKKLSKQKSSLGEKDNYGDTPLINALRTPIREPEISAPGIDRKLNRQIVKDQELAILMTRELLNAGSDVNERGHSGVTPLIQTVSQFFSTDNCLKLLTILFTFNPDVNLRDEQGFTALMYAARKGKPEIVKFLLAHNAQLDLKNCAGETALSIARTGKKDEIIQILQNSK